MWSRWRRTCVQSREKPRTPPSLMPGRRSERSKWRSPIPIRLTSGSIGRFSHLTHRRRLRTPYDVQSILVFHGRLRSSRTPSASSEQHKKTKTETPKQQQPTKKQQPKEKTPPRDVA